MFRIVRWLFDFFLYEIFKSLYVCLSLNKGETGLPGNKGSKGMPGKPVSQFSSWFIFIPLFMSHFYKLEHRPEFSKTS